VRPLSPLPFPRPRSCAEEARRAEASDYTHLWNALRERISLVKGGAPQPGQGMFGHITTGYDAGYYGYTYSLVFAADMYATVFAADPLDPARGRHYRESVLLPGGSRDEMASLRVSVFAPAQERASRS
jgi:Zn-dependent oligopeptidase